MCLGLPGEILEISGEGTARSARVDFNGISREVSLAFLPETEIGDFIVVHVGIAISKLSKESANESHQLWQQIQEQEAP